jgi:hypothetical protein
MIWFLYLIAAAAGLGLHLWFSRTPPSAGRVVEVALLYLLVFFAGVSGLVSALAHTFWAAQIARQIGWAPGSPFQFEVAMANLAFGVLGIMCIWQRGNFWAATGIGLSVFLLGCAYGHLKEVVVAGNYAPDNVGPVLWFNDLAIPILILGLLLARHRLAPASGKNRG